MNHRRVRSLFNRIARLRGTGAAADLHAELCERCIVQNQRGAVRAPRLADIERKLEDLEAAEVAEWANTPYPFEEPVDDKEMGKLDHLKMTPDEQETYQYLVEKVAACDLGLTTKDAASAVWNNGNWQESDDDWCREFGRGYISSRKCLHGSGDEHAFYNPPHHSNPVAYAAYNAGWQHYIKGVS